MGLFNVIKGAYPSLQQIDKALPVATGVSGIVRGTCIYEDNGEWKVAATANAGGATTPGVMIHFALMDQDDLTVGMAGRLTGLSCAMPAEVETDQFTGSPTLGDFLTIGADGKLVSVEEGDFAGGNGGKQGYTLYGQVTRAPYRRWSNAEPSGYSTNMGAPVTAIRFRTLYLPNTATQA